MLLTNPHCSFLSRLFCQSIWAMLYLWQRHQVGVVMKFIMWCCIIPGYCTFQSLQHKSYKIFIEASFSVICFLILKSDVKCNNFIHLENICWTTFYPVWNMDIWGWSWRCSCWLQSYHQLLIQFPVKVQNTNKITS